MYFKLNFLGLVFKILKILQITKIKDQLTEIPNLVLKIQSTVFIMECGRKTFM